MIQENDTEFLECRYLLDEFIPKIGKDKWQTVFLKDTGPHWRKGSYIAVWCALLKPEAAKRSLESDNLNFDLEFCSSAPDIGTRYPENREPEIYYEPSHNKSIRPFVLVGYDEGLCEEFRLFHRSKLNDKYDRLVVIDDSDNPTEIAKLGKDRVQVHLKYLKQFLAMSQLHLVINIKAVRYSKDDFPYSNEDIQIDNGVINDFRWERRICEADSCPGDSKWCSVFRGKKIIAPASQSEAFKKMFKPDKRRDEIQFIVGIDEHGEDITFGSNPAYLADFFGANPESPNFLTPTQFRKEVLTKYYNHPERYRVDQGLVRSGSWSLRADTDHKDKVIVFLGDLYALPYDEMLYWKSFNVPVDGNLSRSYFQNSFMCNPVDAETADLKFRRNYVHFNKAWKNKYKFYFFRELSEHDITLIDTIQIPASNAQKVFDQQVLNLAKLLIDQINVEALNNHYGPFNETIGSIQKLEQSFPCEAEDIVPFLRDLQSLRSSGSAHTKGRNYQKALRKMEISLQDKPKAFEQILNLAISHLENLSQNCLLETIHP
ncbi:MAG: hypothetical protein ACON4F_09585 [Candidatus Puniceispirillaceae bacterium]